jgi:hypothetical protein
VTSKPYFALLSLSAACLAVVTTVGFLQLCGVYYADIVNVMPFLAVCMCTHTHTHTYTHTCTIIAKGIDEMFILLSVWRTSKSHGTKHGVISDRMAETLAESAVSITITSFSDALSFAVGIISTMPAGGLLLLDFTLYD